MSIDSFVNSDAYDRWVTGGGDGGYSEREEPTTAFAFTLAYAFLVGEVRHWQ